MMSITETITASPNKKSIGKLTRPIKSSGREKVIGVGSMEGFRKSLEMDGISVKAVKLISEARRAGSEAN